MALTVTGILSTGQTELDRNLLYAPVSSVQDAFGLGDEVHNLVLDGKLHGQLWLRLLAICCSRTRATVPGSNCCRGRTGYRVGPFECDLYYILLILVSFAVLNTFIMVIFERTREFGMPWR